ncbi:Cardiolipin synthase [Frankliniella fusca]|uniref:Cardiolipin synthase n=1 Tax=Frankliniella fusca TaxID=407009 RepID=A0AAE1HZX7_9NEOP|nr:Cardiolipin synthase [Frankliniella fusca]
MYGPPKTTGQVFDKEDDFFKSVQAQPRHLTAALRAGSVDEHGIRVTDMSCLRTAHRARFTATITSPRFVAWPPVLEAVPGGGAAPTDCRIIADPADPHHRFLVDLSNPDLTRCGVKGCSADGEPRLCTRVLMPSLAGLRLASDPVLLLQCALQPASVSLLQQARLAAVQPASARSAGVVHAGGERAPLHVQLQLYRRGAAGDFSRAMQPGGAVHLGDELQLRATVRRGDGWQSSRLSDVVVRRGSDAVHLVGADGCSNPEMRAVCPRDQAWLAGEPLSSLLTMRVFMFRGMQDGDQLVLTARVVACLDRADCKLSAGTCEAAARHVRTRRSSGGGGGLNATSISLEESVTFVVRRGSEEEDSTELIKREADASLQRNILTAAVLLSAAVLPSTVLLLYWCKHKKVILR